MDKKFLILALIICVMLLIGCSNNGSRGNSGRADVRTGTKGLQLSLLPGAPPEKFLGPGKMSIGLQVKNLGATTIDGQVFGGNVYISGYDPNVFQNVRGPTGQNHDGLGALSGKGLSDPTGGMEVKEFETDINLDEGIPSYKTTILLTACYSYETLASTQVCVDPDPFSTTTKQKVCQTKDVSLSGGQGAPVAVTKVEAAPSAGKIRFTIYIQNVGGGLVYDKETPLECSPYSDGISYKHLDQVNVVEVKLGGSSMNCKGLTGNQIKLIEGKRSFLCEYDIPGGTSSAFNSPMSIKLQYGYRDSASRNIEILRSP